MTISITQRCARNFDLPLDDPPKNICVLVSSSKYGMYALFKFSDFEKGWVGYMASYNGRFFDGGYSGISAGRNYIHESMLNIINQIDKLQGVEFQCCSYDKLNIPNKSIIYCDIPYKDSKQYDRVKFDYDKFYQWCFDKKSEGHKVYISEYWMPDDFDCIWDKEVKCNINIEKRTRIEKLFTI